MASNPFELIEAKLSNIENLLLDIKHQPNQVETSNQQEQLLTIQQASDFLCLSVPTLYTKVSHKELPCMKRGKRLYFSRTELMEYIKQGKKKTLAEIESEADQYLIKRKGGRK